MIDSIVWLQYERAAIEKLVPFTKRRSEGNQGLKHRRLDKCFPSILCHKLLCFHVALCEKIDTNYGNLSFGICLGDIDQIKYETRAYN